MTMDDPAHRAMIAEVFGPAEYNRRMEQHRQDSTVATVNGHAIRRVQTERFGTLFHVGKTNMAFPTLERAEKFARETAPAA